MGLSRFVRLQIWLSVAFLISLGLFFLITWLMGIDLTLDHYLAGLTNSSAMTENTEGWEILIVDLNRRGDLWEKFDSASENERQEFYRALVKVLSLVPEEQADHIAGEVLKKRWSRRSPPSTAEKESILKSLEEMTKKFRRLAWRAAQLIARELQRERLNGDERDQLRASLSRFKAILHDHLLKNCLDTDEFENCSKSLAQENSDEARDTLWKFSQSAEGRPKRKILLVLLATGGDSRPKFRIGPMLASGKTDEMILAINLIRAYKLRSYLAELENLETKVQNEELRKEISLTLRQLR